MFISIVLAVLLVYIYSMKIRIVTFFTLALIHVPHIFSCEAPPGIGGNCKGPATLIYSQPDSNKLLKRLRSYYLELESSVKRDSLSVYKLRKWDESCFLLNSAIESLIFFEAYSKKNSGKVCRHDVLWIASESKRLIKANAQELDYISNKKSLNKLKKMREVIKKLIFKFEDAHK
jgi:hypothetical protein